MPSDRRVVLVTGASRGIGAAVAKRASMEGFHVILNHRASASDAENVASAIRTSGGTADVEQADVTEIAQTRAMMARIRERCGRLDALVNNAGRRDDGLLLLTSIEKWWSTFNDNVSAVVTATRAALPLLLAQEGASIVNVSSISGLRGVEGQTAYSAAKAAVVGFTKALARELAGKVTVNCVAPGPIETDMYMGMPESQRKARLALLPLKRIGRVEEVAEVVALLIGGKATFVHGQTVAIDGGAST